MVIGWLKQRLRARRDIRRKLAVAERQFSLAYPARKLIRSMTSVFHSDRDLVVVQLCHEWGGIPPEQSWWRVSSDGSCRELSFEDANQIRPVPPWR